MKLLCPSTLYATIMGGLLLLLFLIKNTGPILGVVGRTLDIVRKLLAIPARRAIFLTLKHVVYPLVLKKKSRLWILLQLIYWPGNIFTTFIGTQNIAGVRVRSGYMSIINLAPLLMSDRLRFLADIFGIPIHAFLQIHGTLGIMSSLQGTLHVCIALHEVGWHPKQNLQLYGLLAIFGVFLSLVTIILRRFSNEIMSKFHAIAAFIVGIAVFCHLQQLRDFSKLCLLLSSLSIIMIFMIRYILVLLRNLKYPKIGSQAAITRMDKTDTLRLVIPINRPFKVQAGMVVYIWMPSVGLRSVFQTYCYPICWWDNDTNGNATSITLFARRGKGFTQRLMVHQKKYFLTWIDGPYGLRKPIEDYSRVLLIATGLGITSILSYIRLAVESNLRTRTHRDIFVVWEVEDKSQLDWIYDWMDSLLKKDEGIYKLCFALHVPSNLDHGKADEAWNSTHGRVFKAFSPIHVKEVVPTKFWADEGKSLVVVSAEKRIVSGIVDTIPHEMTSIVHLVEMPLQPTNDQKRHSTHERGDIMDRQDPPDEIP